VENAEFRTIIGDLILEHGIDKHYYTGLRLFAVPFIRG